jgi:exopolysaccharide biosynthesis polyprenyl glycosylphosphotransferase
MTLETAMHEEAGSDSSASGPRSKRPWEVSYARRLLVTDILVITWAVIGAQVARFGFMDTELAVLSRRADLGLSYSTLSIALILAWIATLAIFATRDSRIVGTGSTEYRRIIDASVRLFGIVAIIAFLSKIDIARSYILLAFPVGVLALLASRWIWRQWLAAKRLIGEYSARVLLVGSFDSVVAIARDLDRLPMAGYRVVGAVVPGHQVTHHLPGTTIPLSNKLDAVRQTMDAALADTVIVTSSDELPPQRMRELSWSLEPGRQHLVVAPSLTDIGGPRIHMRPVAGLPLIHVETPRYEGIKAFSKRTFDVVVSGTLILLFAWLLIALAVAVRLSSPGPLLYRSQRIGYRGEPFEMLKYRSMRAGADLELTTLLEEQGTADKPLFKIVDDPRITPLGRVLRKHSLDELPQLFNVFFGSMSLVGPRPQVAAEVAMYDDAAARRLFLKPGVSGLWQVSGRSNLSWEDAIRLDLYYVENWSLTGDLLILWRTIRAVVLPGKEAS